MSELVYKETHHGHTIKIHYDTDADSPRSWDNLGTMICGHSRYNLGDQHSFTGGRDFLLDLLELDEDAPFGIEFLLAQAQKTHIVLPVYLFDHSGLAMNTTGFHCPWDSGQVGFIYVSLEKVRDEYNVRRVSAKRREQIAEHLRQEVKTYNDYLGGDVYGYVIEDEAGEEIDSCWGFIGDYEGYCLKEARACVPRPA